MDERINFALKVIIFIKNVLLNFEIFELIYGSFITAFSVYCKSHLYLQQETIKCKKYISF